MRGKGEGTEIYSSFKSDIMKSQLTGYSIHL